MKLSTQKNMLAFMLKHNACREACEYVSRFSPKHPAKLIWRCCPYPDWMFWLGARWNPEVALAYSAKCVKRIESEHAIFKPNADQLNYIGTAKRDYERAKSSLDSIGYDNYFYQNVTWAMYESHRAAKSYNEEVAVRIMQLRAMW